MVDKAPTFKHVTPESLLVSILNDLFVISSNGHWEETTNSSFIGSLKFAKVGRFTSKTAPLTKSVTLVPRVGLDFGHLLKSALAGGVSCAFSAFLMHPLDTVKVISLRLTSASCVK